MLEIRQFLETALNNFQKRGVYLSKEDLQYFSQTASRGKISSPTPLVGETPSNDHIRVYLTEMGRVSLLPREDEVHSAYRL